MTYVEIILDQTKRSIMSLKNVVDCMPEESWNKEYCDMPFWKHIYHTVHSLDKWYINPECYTEPEVHVENLNDLDVYTGKQLTRAEICGYIELVSGKIMNYILSLNDAELSECPEGCEYSKFHLIIAQHRHLDMHIGMMMGYIIADTKKWPRVFGLQSELSSGQSLFF